MSEETSKVLLGGQAKNPAYEPGQVIEVKNYPFSVYVFRGCDIDGPFSDDGWRPGCEKDVEEGGGIAYTADGLGSMLLEVVQVVTLPGNFAPRVFYVRQWRDPDGKVFGKRTCRVTTTSAFSKMAKGYRHEFYLDGELFNARSSFFSEEVAARISDLERDCCGTFKGSPHRKACEQYRGKKGGE